MFYNISIHLKKLYNIILYKYTFRVVFFRRFDPDTGGVHNIIKIIIIINILCVFIWEYIESVYIIAYNKMPSE